MDLKALMQKLETIDKKQNLMEAEKKETTWTDKSGKKHPATQVKGDKYTGKEAEKDAKKKADEGIVFNSSIANALLREFGLEEAPVTNPYKGADAEKFAAMSPEDQAWLTKGGGVPDINDQYILMRAPNKGKPAAGGQGASPAAPAPTGTTAQGDDDGNTMITKPDGTTQVVGPDGNAIKPGSNPNLPQNKPAAQAASPAMTAADQDDADMGAAMRANAQAANGVNAAGQNVTMPNGINPETGAPTVTTAGAPAAGGQAASPAKPAAPAANKSMTPAITAYAASMGLLKNNKPDVEAIKKFQTDNGLKADGIIGPNTAGAILSAQKPGMAGSGRGGQGGPTAAQAGGQAASPAANPKTAEIDAQLAKYKKYPQSNAQIIARLEKEKAALTGGQAASPAAPAAPAPTTSGGRPYTPPKQEESIVTQDDAILARIKSALRF